MKTARAFYRFYIESMNKKPWQTTIISTGLLVGTGDIIAQQAVERKRQSHDWFRTAKMTGMGIFIIGPGLRTWYIILERLVVGTGKTVALKKMILDQAVWAPSFLAMFLSVVSVLNGKSTDEIKDKFKKDYGSMLKVNYMIWPAVQLLNFYFIPMQHRVVVVNFVALFWNTYLAYASHRN